MTVGAKPLWTINCPAVCGTLCSTCRYFPGSFTLSFDRDTHVHASLSVHAHLLLVECAVGQGVP